MKKIIYLIVFILYTSLMFGINLGGWNYYEKDSFKVFYEDGYEYYAIMTLSALIEHKDEIKKITGNQDDIKTKIIIQDMGQYLNGYADNLNQKIAIYVNPSEASGDFANTNNWLRLVGVHEYTHMMQLNNKKGLAKKLSFLFGNQMSPNQVIPSWIVEGITVYEESQLNEKEGRMNGGYYDKMISVKAKEDKLPSTTEAAYYHDTYPAGQHYLYGGSFFTYLSEKYGEGKIAEFFNKNAVQWWTPFYYSGYLFPYIGIDKAAKKTFGKRFPKLFKDWEDHEKIKIKDIKMTRQKIDDNVYFLSKYGESLYYQKRKKQRVGAYEYRSYYEIISFDLKTKQKKVILKLRTPLLNNIRAKEDKIYYSVGNTKRGYKNIDGNGYGIESKIYSFDLKRKKKKLILKESFYDFEIAENDDIYIIKREKESYASSIVKINGDRRDIIYKTEDIISQLKLYNDDIYMVSKTEFGSWDIKKLEDGKAKDILSSYCAEYNMNIENGEIYFNSSYTRELGMYRYDIKSKKLYEVDLGLSGIYGFKDNKNLYFRGIDSEGEHLYKRKYSEKELKDIDEKYLKTEKEYMGYDKIKLKAKKSYWENYKYLFIPSMRDPFHISGEDALGINSYHFYNTFSFGDVDKNIDTDVVFTSKILSPLIFTYMNFDSEILDFTLPVYRSNEKGLSNVSLSFTKDDELKYSSAAFDFTYTGFKFGLSHSRESEKSGFRSGGYISKYFSKAKLKFSYYDFKDFKTEAGQEGLDTYSYDKGNKTNAELSLKTLEIRKGLWNPNCFIGDIYTRAFYQRDYFDNWNSEINYYGFGISTEFGLGMYSNLIVDIANVYNDRDENGLQLIVRYPY